MSIADAGRAVPTDDFTPHSPNEQPDPLLAQDRPAAAAVSENTLQHEAVTGRLAHDPYAALRLPVFRKFFVAFFLSAAGGQVQTAAVGWEIYSTTGNPLDLGWLGLALAVPMLLLSLPAGHLADTMSRKKLFLFMQVTTSICAVGLMLLSWRNASGVPMPHHLGWMYALLAFGAVGATIGRPGREALMAQMVPASLYPNAVTWNSTSFELSSMGGPALGGLIVAWFNPAAAYATAAVCFAASFVLICLLPDHRVERTADATGRPSAGLSDLAAGIKFVFRSKLILAALTLDLFAVLFGGATFLLPVFAKDILHVDAFGFGCLRAAPAIGAVTMALVQAHRRPYRHAGRTLLFTVAGFGLATVVFGLSRNYLLSFTMLILTGVFDNISVVIRHSLVPLATPDPMRGRVLAVNQIFVGSSNELGGLESGLTAAWLGPVYSVVLGGLASVGVVIAVALRYPEVRRLGSLNDVRPIDSLVPSPGTPGEG